MTSRPKLYSVADNLAVACQQGPANWWMARKAIKRHGAIQKTRELAMFLRLLRGRRLQVVVEIGTAQGGTFWALAHAAQPDATLISLDLPPQERHSGGEKRAIDLKPLCQPGQTVHQLLGDSHSQEMFDRLAAVLGNRPIDLLFIDGDHTYEGVRRDFELYTPLVGQEGLVGFHDIIPTQWEHCGVERFWRELIGGHRGRSLEFVDPHGAAMGGIGVLVDPQAFLTPAIAR